MKVLAAFALILASCALVGAACVVMEPKPSSRTAKITVLRDGKPQPNVKLTVTLPNVKDSRSVVTDLHGVAVLKDLPVGTNCVAASGEDYFQAILCLAVSVERLEKMSSFALMLVDTLPAPGALDRNAAPARLRRLALSVVDPAGEALPHAEVQVFKRGSYPQELIAKAWTDSDGRFAVPLRPGSYVISIRMPAFRSASQAIEISPEGREGELREVLQVGSC